MIDKIRNNCFIVGCLSRFKRQEHGAITVEAVLWVPVYLIFFSLIADVSLIFHAQAKATRIAYDGNRQASAGVFETEAETRTAVLGRVQSFSPGATVSTVFGTDEITTTVSMPTSDLAPVGLVSQLMNINISVSSVHMRDS